MGMECPGDACCKLSDKDHACCRFSNSASFRKVMAIKRKTFQGKTWFIVGEKSKSQFLEVKFISEHDEFIVVTTF